MTINNALAGMAVKDLNKVVGWYERLIGEAPNRPMPEVAEWKFPNGGCLQVFQDAERAGQSSLTLAVSDLERQIADAKAQGVAIGKTASSSKVKTAIISDPDGNRIVFAQALSDELAS